MRRPASSKPKLIVSPNSLAHPQRRHAPIAAASNKSDWCQLDSESIALAYLTLLLRCFAVLPKLSQSPYVGPGQRREHWVPTLRRCGQPDSRSPCFPGHYFTVPGRIRTCLFRGRAGDTHLKGEECSPLAGTKWRERRTQFYDTGTLRGESRTHTSPAKDGPCDGQQIPKRSDAFARSF